MGGSLDLERTLQRGDDLLRDVSRAALIRARKDQRELVAAEPCHRVGLAELRRDAPRDLTDEKVSGLVPEGVVNLLEAIEVHHQKSERRREPTRGPEGLLEAVEKQRPVR